MPRNRLSAVLYQQDSLITRAQALALGLSDGAIRHAIAPSGKWQIVVPGIYAAFTGPLTELHRLRAAVLFGGPASVITGATACRLYRLSYVPKSDDIDVLVRADTRRREPQGMRFHRTSRLPAPTFWTNGDVDTARHGELMASDALTNGALKGQIPLAPPGRAALDAVQFQYSVVRRSRSGRVPPRLFSALVRDTRALLCEVVQRRRASVDTMLDELRMTASRNRAVASLAMDDIVAGCRSAPECELRDLVKISSVLPEPRWNQPLPGYRPKHRSEALTPDGCIQRARLVIEVDSVEWHRIGPRQEHTEKRRARYAELGWLVISVSPHRIRHEPDEVLREIERAYLASINRQKINGNLL
jgi:hypothetical protein